jgi:anti-sigma regulatory factor (Ser/Thr protein kinase)
MSPQPSPSVSPAEAVALGEDQTFALSYAARENSIGPARRALRQFAEAGGAATTAQLDAIALASSEAITNVVQHAYADSEGDIHICARLTAAWICIVVADDGLGFAHVTTSPGLGRGLDLMRHSSDEMDLEARAEGGVRVRMRFGLG